MGKANQVSGPAKMEMQKGIGDIGDVSIVRIYVVADDKHLASAKPEGRSWWCVTGKSRPGDIGLIYVRSKGIKYLFRLNEFAEDSQFCRMFDMTTAEIEILKVHETPVSFGELRQHPTLRNMRAVRRSFQGRWFEVEAEFLAELLNLR